MPHLVYLSILSLFMGSDSSVYLNNRATKPTYHCFLANDLSGYASFEKGRVPLSVALAHTERAVGVTCQ